jgi:hypothetical protein
VAERASAQAEPPSAAVLDELKQRNRILGKLWTVVWFERNRSAVNADPLRSPQAPIYGDTTFLSLDDAYKVWRGERVPAGAL